MASASMGVAVEVFGWAERNAETATARALKLPGYELQRGSARASRPRPSSRSAGPP